MPNEKRKVIAIDFDGTLCENKWPEIGKPATDIINAAKYEKLYNGAALILYTMREGDSLNEAVVWCARYGLYFDAINDNLEELKIKFNNNPRKIYADEYWDDHNCTLNGIKVREELYRCNANKEKV